MTAKICFRGTLLSDASSKICFRGSLIDEVCHDGSTIYKVVAPTGAPVAPVLTNQTGPVSSALSYTTPAWTGTGPITMTWSTLPDGATAIDNGNGTVTFGGTFRPTAGADSVTVTGTNAGGSSSATFSLTATSTLSATVTFAPTPQNPGRANPAYGVHTELQSSTWDNLLSATEYNNHLDLVVSGFTGGTGPYEVDFSGVSWQLESDTRLFQAHVYWTDSDANVNDTSVGNQVFGTNATTHSGTAPSSAKVTVAGSGYAMFCARFVLPSRPPSTATPMFFTNSYGAGTVKVTDSLGDTVTLSFPSISQTWSVTGGGTGGGGGSSGGGPLEP